MDLAILLLPTLKSLQTARVSVHLSANPDLPRARSECFLCSYGQFSATYFSTGLFCQRIINSHLPSFSFTTLRPCVARAVRQESRALRKMLQGPRLRTILLSSLVISCHLLQFSNLPIQLVKIATGWPSMLLGSFHPKRLVFRHVRVHLRWIPLDDPISFHIAVATLVAVNSFVRVGSPVCVWRYPTQKIKSASKSIERWNRMDTG